MSRTTRGYSVDGSLCSPLRERKIMIAREDQAANEADGRSSKKSVFPDRTESIPPGPNSDGSSPTAGDEPSPFDPLLRHLSELQMLAGHYLRARADQISARVRLLLFWAIAGLIALIIAVAFLVTAVVLLLRGISNGLVLLRLQPWAADLITGVVCIGAVGATIAVVLLSQKFAARRKRRDDYEHFRARFRAKFGHGFEESGRNDN
jgi:hypothetical protein